MVKKCGLLVCMVMVLGSLCGCVALLAGAAGGAGTAYWLSGKLVHEADVSFAQAIEASKSGLQALQLEIVKETRKGDIAQIISKYIDGATVWIDIHRVTSMMSRIEIRVGAASDEAAARKILNEIIPFL
ncbi:DUF3568 family protein [Candidatus Omnitrophota bacterium]